MFILTPLHFAGNKITAAFYVKGSTGDGSICIVTLLLPCD